MVPFIPITDNLQEGCLLEYDVNKSFTFRFISIPLWYWESSILTPKDLKRLEVDTEKWYVKKVKNDNNFTVIDP